MITFIYLLKRKSLPHVVDWTRIDDVTAKIYEKPLSVAQIPTKSSRRHSNGGPANRAAGTFECSYGPLPWLVTGSKGICGSDARWEGKLLKERAIIDH